MHQSLLSRLVGQLRSLGRRLCVERGGNVIIIVAGAMIPMTFAVGFGIDYARAMKLQSQMGAAADAAAVAAVTAMSMQDNSTAGQTKAQTAAINMFTGQVANLKGVIFNKTNDLIVTISTTGALNNGRRVMVQWRAQSTNIFAGLLGAPSLPISGTVSSQAIKAPYINFYLVMDTSPSMLLPTTSTGLSSIRTATSTTSLTSGCDFACHEQNPHSDAVYIRDSSQRDIYLSANYYTSGQPGFQTYYLVNASTNKVYNSAGTLLSGYTYSNGTVSYTSGRTTTSVPGYFADGYWLTHNYGSVVSGSSSIEVRIDAERVAAQQLIPYAANQASANGVTYNLQMYAFNWSHPGSTNNPVTALTSTMADVGTLSASSVPDLYASQDYWANNGCPTSSNCINDAATEFNNMFTTMNNIMPTPGDGTTSSSPQEVMFLITDGMSDEVVNGSRWNRELNLTDLAQCTTIKSRGIRIAVLYTQYLPDALTGDSWSQSNVAPYLGNVAPALQACASSGSDGTALFYQVTTDQNISDALVTLFALTVQQAHLIQ